MRDEIESIAVFYRRYEGHPAAICVARAQIGASTLKNSNPPEAGDRPLGGGPGCYIARALERILELSEKQLAGEQLSSLARGRPAGLRCCSCRSRRGVGAQTNRKPPTKARKLESRPDFTGEAKECASAYRWFSCR